MWQNFVGELTRTINEILNSFARFVPRFIEMLLMVLAGWVIAFLLRIIVRSILRIARFDKLSEHTGAAHLLRKATLPSPSEMVARFVFWVAWIGFILVGVSVLPVPWLWPHISNFFAFLPRLVAAIFILFFGLLGATFFSRAALLGGVNAEMPSPRLISQTLRTMMVLFVISMAFEVVGIGSWTILITFSLAFGALMLGLAIAFGLGGKDLARRYLERRFGRDHFPDQPSREREDELSPL
ncbi:MAG TPA: hypothetical protein VJ731_09675 [Terriglobales bacterium]|nr:hypothetical protein [Terriglobales bacterium]